MFGYISPIESEMGPEDRATFRAFYCGTCKQMGWPACMALSYECAFLAAVRSSCGQAQPICTKRCPVKPYKKVEIMIYVIKSTMGQGVRCAFCGVHLSQR